MKNHIRRLSTVSFQIKDRTKKQRSSQTVTLIPAAMLQQEAKTIKNIKTFTPFAIKICRKH